MGKMIINNDSSISDDAALVIVVDCVRAGRISNGGKQYCYASKYTIDGIPVMVTTTLNKNSDSFCLYDARITLASS